MPKKILAVGMMCLIMLLGVAFCSTPSLAAEFSADINQRLQGRDIAGRIFVKGEKYRVELLDSKGRRTFIIVDQKADLTTVMDPAEKKYMETPSTGILSLMNDPFQSARYMETKFKKVLLGKEMISGYECAKFKFVSDKQEMMTVWKARNLGFPLKISLHDKKHSFIVLKNIKEGPIEEALFRVPAGYSKQEDRAKKREREEAALPVITTSVRAEAPWARRIGQGGEIRVKVDPRKSVRFIFENLFRDESVFTVKAFRNSRPIKMDIKETYSLGRKGQRKKPLLGLQNKADEVVIRVEKGKILANVANQESAFAKDKIKTFFIVTGHRKWTHAEFLDAKRPLRLIITSDSQDSKKSRVKVTFYKGDYKNIIDKDEIVLINGRSKTWNYSAGKGIKTLEIAVAEGGGVKVRIEQPAPGKSLKPKQTLKIARTASVKRSGKRVMKSAPGKPPGPRLSRKQAGKIIKAINANDIALVKSELDRGMDINSTLYGGTLLMKAANLGTPDMVKMLISRGADLKYKTRRGDDALSVGMNNSRHWQQVVPILMEAGITVDENTPLWVIGFKTKKGKLLPEAKKVLEFLFAKGASPDSYITKNKSTLIMYYAKKGWLDPLKFFLDHGANVNARTLDGKTALSMALTKPRRPERPAQKKERQAVVNLLRSKGAK